MSYDRVYLSVCHSAETPFHIKRTTCWVVCMCRSFQTVLHANIMLPHQGLNEPDVFQTIIMLIVFVIIIHLSINTNLNKCKLALRCYNIFVYV